MAKPTLYIETTFVSYLTARPSRDLITAGHQQRTREWWEKRRADFDLLTSELVLREAASGDPKFAKERLETLVTMKMLALTPTATDLADQLLKGLAFPTKATADAVHLAIAATQGVHYLLTWNCKHLANAAMRPRIENICRAAGFVPPIICTPDELLEG